MGWLPERQPPPTPARQGANLPASRGGGAAARGVNLPAPGPPHQHQSAAPATSLQYQDRPGFRVMEAAQLPPLFYDHLRSLVPDPPEGMWYTSTQSFGDRLEATALAVGPDRLVVVNGVQPMRRDGTSDGRPRLRAVGPWKLDQVTIPYLPGTVHVTRLAPGPLTVAGGTRPNIDRNADLMRQLSNLPAVVQDHLETYIPSLQRTRRWVRSLGPTTAKPERFWLYTTSHDRLAYVHSTRWHHCDPSGLPSDPAREPWAVTTLTAMIGPARRDQLTLDGRAKPVAQTPKRPSLATGKRALRR